MARGKGEAPISKRVDGRCQTALQVNGRRRTVYGRTQQEVVLRLKALKKMGGTPGRPARRQAHCR